MFLHVFEGLEGVIRGILGGSWGLEDVLEASWAVWGGYQFLVDEFILSREGCMR